MPPKLVQIHKTQQCCDCRTHEERNQDGGDESPAYVDKSDSKQFLQPTPPRLNIDKPVPKRLTVDDIQVYITDTSVDLSNNNQMPDGSKKVRDINLTGRFMRNGVDKSSGTNATVASTTKDTIQSSATPDNVSLQAPLVNYKLPVSLPCKVRPNIPSAGSTRSRSPIDITKQLQYLNSRPANSPTPSQLSKSSQSLAEPAPFKIAPSRKGSGLVKSQLAPLGVVHTGVESTSLKVTNSPASTKENKHLAQLSKFLDANKIDMCIGGLKKKSSRQVSSMSTAQICDYTVVFGSRI